ncbi:MAG: CRISPR-associated protein Cas4 [Candidatus Hodarchaeota archaeon]
MHYISFLDTTTQSLQSIRKMQKEILLRGYNPDTWIPPEFSDITLPVNLLAYNQCPIHRDVYLNRIEKIPLPESWNRYQGLVIVELYKKLHILTMDSVSKMKVKNFQLYEYLIGKQDEIIDEVKKKFHNYLRNLNPLLAEKQPEEFDKQLRKIIRFEAELSSALIDFQISKQMNIRLRSTIEDLFPFNLDLTLSAPRQGFSGPAAPDFIYRHQVVGDIKSGKWKEFFHYTYTAYALAYECDRNSDINYGAILSVEVSLNRPVPLYQQSTIELISDEIRKRFLVIRNRKLEIVYKGEDPGHPDKALCDPKECGYYFYCWES